MSEGGAHGEDAHQASTSFAEQDPLPAPLEEESVARRLAEEAAAAKAEKTKSMGHIGKVALTETEGEMSWRAKEAELEGRGDCFGLS